MSLVSAVLCVLWSGQTAATLFVRRCSQHDGQLVLIAYPCVLMYTTFVLLTLY